MRLKEFILFLLTFLITVTVVGLAKATNKSCTINECRYRGKAP